MDGTPHHAQARLLFQRQFKHQHGEKLPLKVSLGHFKSDRPMIVLSHDHDR
jgi:hypothetical protein